MLSGLAAFCLGGLAVGLPLSADSAEKHLSVTALQKIVEGTPAIELPAVARRLIAEVSQEEQSRIGVRIVRVFLQGRAAIGPSLLSTLCQVAPQAAVNITTEAVRLFPEHSFSLVRASVTAVPDLAIPITLFTALAEPDRADEFVQGFRRSQPDQVAEMERLVGLFASKRITTLADAIHTTNIRIGSSVSTVPADPNDARNNNPPPAEQLRFLDIPEEVPEDFSGSEILSQFDRILRELYEGDDTKSDDDVTIKRYVR